jgi:hypothetical protein
MPDPPARRHVHDFEMEFDSTDFPLDYTLRCKCGVTAINMCEAIRLTRESQGTWYAVHREMLERVPVHMSPRSWAAGAFLAASSSFFVWAIGRGMFW